MSRVFHPLPHAVTVTSDAAGHCAMRRVRSIQLSQRSGDAEAKRHAGVEMKSDSNQTL